ncbi:hypothetical protein CJD36_003675 [Flavipsychrobacter stenotrophus]|uniref:Uncharacterized protein n=1 Tax=Flavipsychrobacter stenotrophus TaxID=2077091 RepID=A0A2S7T1M3_9BACT|nr:hypothetical protein [Flavipsychrobacter stenotrophus]PQJ12854.1 hypothetical protein CJD36_003675 [Flavipsychrobacter stenotrophus]
MISGNNPGNIRPGIGYKGENGTHKGASGLFVTFDTMENGIRAFFMNFYAAVHKHGRKTLTDYITAYAPPDDDNDTESYINTMAEKMGIDADEPIPLDTHTALQLARAQFEIEDGAAAHTITEEQLAGGLAAFRASVAGFFLKC